MEKEKNKEKEQERDRERREEKEKEKNLKKEKSKEKIIKEYQNVLQNLKQNQEKCQRVEDLIIEFLVRAESSRQSFCESTIPPFSTISKQLSNLVVFGSQNIEKLRDSKIMRVGIIGAPQIQMQLINTLLNRDLLKTLATSLPSSDFSISDEIKFLDSPTPPKYSSIEYENFKKRIFHENIEGNPQVNVDLSKVIIPDTNILTRIVYGNTFKVCLLIKPLEEIISIFESMQNLFNYQHQIPNSCAIDKVFKTFLSIIGKDLSTPLNQLNHKDLALPKKFEAYFRFGEMCSREFTVQSSNPVLCTTKISEFLHKHASSFSYWGLISEILISMPLPLLENGFEFILFKSSNEVAFESSLQEIDTAIFVRSDIESQQQHKNVNAAGILNILKENTRTSFYISILQKDGPIYEVEQREEWNAPIPRVFTFTNVVSICKSLEMVLFKYLNEKYVKTIRSTLKNFQHETISLYNACFAQSIKLHTICKNSMREVNDFSSRLLLIFQSRTELVHEIISKTLDCYFIEMRGRVYSFKINDRMYLLEEQLQKILTPFVSKKEDFISLLNPFVFESTIVAPLADTLALIATFVCKECCALFFNETQDGIAHENTLFGRLIQIIDTILFSRFYEGIKSQDVSIIIQSIQENIRMILKIVTKKEVIQFLKKFILSSRKNCFNFLSQELFPLQQMILTDSILTCDSDIHQKFKYEVQEKLKSTFQLVLDCVGHEFDKYMIGQWIGMIELLLKQQMEAFLMFSNPQGTSLFSRAEKKVKDIHEIQQEVAYLLRH